MTSPADLAATVRPAIDEAQGADFDAGPGPEFTRTLAEQRHAALDALLEQAVGWRAIAEDADGVLFVKRAEAAEAERDRLRVSNAALNKQWIAAGFKVERLAARVAELGAVLRLADEIADAYGRLWAKDGRFYAYQDARAALTDKETT